MLPPKKILVAPLNWGLGHAARVVPIIRELLNLEAEVLMAADGRALELLRKEFPQLKWIRLRGYDIRYQEKGSLTLQLLPQLPKIIASFYTEQKHLKRIIGEEKIEAVISDNRYGLFSKKIPCVFITHQTGIIVPKPFKWTEKFISRINHFLISKFDACWIPDYEGENNLSGDLSHKYPKPLNAIFIGPLSRFSYWEIKKEYDLLILLTGPEPQRTILEKILFQQVSQLSNRNLKLLLVRGITEGSNQSIAVTENFWQVDFLPADQLNNAILASDIIVSRSGYSTVMDMAVLGKKAIFIPTPGQSEQVYLADYFRKKEIFYSEAQKSFDLQRALKDSNKFTGIKVNGGMKLVEALKKMFGSE